MIKLLKALYAVYCLIAFAASFIIVIPCYFIVFNLFSKKKAPFIAHKVSKFWAHLLFVLFLVRCKIENKEHIDPDKQYVFVANHLSMLDIPAYAAACGNTFRFLSKAELAKIPLLGYVIKNLYITVNRTDRADRSKSIERMKATIDEGLSVFLAPEGTRNKTEAPLLDFKDGAFRLAIYAQVPVAVLTLKNPHHLHSPKRMLSMRPGVLHGEWSKPIETKGMTEADVPRLKEMARQQMLAYLQS
jgi:1-acyl-sn-glycerol-3-phosphate acyltransferase